MAYNGGEDRLSSLPDSLLAVILSLLPIESAAATSVLSRRWHHLWTQVTCLHFSRNTAMWLNFDSSNKIYKICPIIDHIFRQLTSPKLHSFLLEFQSSLAEDLWESFGSYLQSWVHHICRLNVEKIKVLLSIDDVKCLTTLPTCVLEAQSLVVLELSPMFDYKLPASGIITLPNLKKLKLHLGDMNHELMRLLFKSCPLLEDLYLLVLCFKDHFVDISSQYLKRLTIMGDINENCKFRIDAPQLEDFEVSTCLYLCSHHFVRDLRSLLKAKIHLETDDIDCLNKISALVQGIASARSLDLDNFLINFVDYLHKGAVPIFHNLTHLKTNLFDPHGWSGLFRFLHFSPNLEVLVLSHHGLKPSCDTRAMEWTVPDSVPGCLVNKLKRMEVEALQGCQKELDFLGYILSNAKVLKRLFLRKFKYSVGGELCKELEFCKNLFTCPRSSFKCRIRVYGRHIRMSSKGFNKKSLDC